MPELPEAETIVQGLAGPVTGQEIQGARILKADVIQGGASAFRNGVLGRSIRQVSRRGKNIVLTLDDTHRLVVNLGMSGRLLHRSHQDPSPPPTHPAVIMELGHGETLVYHDVRRFGRLHLMDAPTYGDWSAGLGPEPLGPRFTAPRLAADLARSVSPIRSWLLDQRRVVGVGNIYANEALHGARIHPQVPASRIPSSAVPALHRSIRKVLRDAIRARGTTLRDYRTAQGGQGSYGTQLRVYGREGEPCHRCREPIQRIVFGNRSAFLCPGCQPPPEE